MSTIGSVRDPRFGKLNTYHDSVLERVFKKIILRPEFDNGARKNHSGRL